MAAVDLPRTIDFENVARRNPGVIAAAAPLPSKQPQPRRTKHDSYDEMRTRSGRGEDNGRTEIRNRRSFQNTHPRSFFATPQISSPRSFYSTFISRIFLIFILMASLTVAAETTTENGRSTTGSRTSSDTSESGSASTTSSVQLPVAFDSVSLTNNITSSCSKFLVSVVGSDDFKNCLPLSAFIRDSTSFFNIMRQGTFKLTAVMDAICKAPVDDCTSIMSSFSGGVRTDETCNADYDSGNPIVRNLYADLIAYRPTYTAGCLTDDDDGSYCFVDAATSTENPEDLFVYSLPLGTPLDKARPTCNSCLNRTMEALAAAARNESQPVSAVYVDAAEKINAVCGVNYATTSIETFESLATATILPSMLTFFATVGAFVFLSI